MREGERGFTLVEMVIAVAIAAILLVAGGAWMMSMRPGALRGAVNDFDSALAVARQLAATSGNGATLAFLPRTDGAQGFMLRVYSGRPNVANAVTATNTMIVSSNATVSDATYGSPPFAIFLSSAGYPTGKASYPAIDRSGNITFPVVATQPPCPSGGIALTFTSPQGATQTRSLQCNVVVTGVAAANPSPTPNPPHIVPQFMLAHWTGDANPLQFKVAEMGYAHWFASSTGTDCQTQGSDNGNAPAAFPSGWPYSSPLTPGETSLAPSAPAAPYSWPNGDVDDPVAAFHMQPSVGGTCAVRIVDDYNQEVDAQVQVMGNLTSSTPSLSFSAPTAPAQTITLTKTWDSEPLQLQAGGGCGGVISVSKGTVKTPASPGTTPATAQLIVAPSSAGSCTLIVGDQYGEPTISIPINVKNPTGPLNTLGAIEFGNQTLAYEPMDVRVAEIIEQDACRRQRDRRCVDVHELSVCAACGCKAATVDANSADGFNTTDATGCMSNGQLPKLWATEERLQRTIRLRSLTRARIMPRSVHRTGVSASYATITPVAPTTGCVFPVESTDKTVANGGSKNVTLVVDR